MKLNIARRYLEIVPEGQSNVDERDLVFIEEVLGLKKHGDSIKLVRKNVINSDSLAYLKTEFGE